MAKQVGNDGATLGFEARLWAAADKRRGNMEPSDYKHVALDLIFLKDIDNAMLAIEARNASLKGVLPKEYARPALNKVMLGELIDLVSGIGMAEKADRSRDILGRVYEYFLGGFAGG